MSNEPKKLRSVDEIRQEYSSLCTKAGHLNYQLFSLTKDLELINDSLRSLNFEAAESAKAEEDAKKAEAKVEG